MMKTHRWADLKKRKLTPEQIKESEQWAKEEALLLTLRELRELAGKTQEEVAGIAEMAQSELSRLEKREDHRLSTIRRYVEALGGKLQVVAVFNDKQVQLVNV